MRCMKPQHLREVKIKVIFFLERGRRVLWCVCVCIYIYIYIYTHTNFQKYAGAGPSEKSAQDT